MKRPVKYDPPFHHSNGFWPVLLVLAGLVVLPWMQTDTYIRHVLILAFVYAVVASNWDLSLGYGGIVNFAHLAFFAIGLYTYGISAKILGVDPWLAIVLGAVVALLFAALLSIPILRLEGVYVILVTVAATQLLARIIVSQSDFTGGTSGMVLLPRLTIGDFKLSSNGRIGYYYGALALLVASTAFLYGIERSAVGRAIKALRDNKYYAISRGVSEARIRLHTLCLSAVFPALAGGFYGAYVRVASPDVFGLGFLTIILSILLVGGIATIWGSLIAAFAVTILAEALADFGAWRDIAVAVVIILVVIVYPGGLHAVVQECWGAFDRIKCGALARFRRHRQAERRARLCGAPDRLVETSLGRVSVFDHGAGARAIVMLHGNSSCKEAFHRQYEALCPRYRVVSFDYPGHGVSPNGNPETAYGLDAFARILGELVAGLDLGRPVVFGWSLGGYVALEYAARGYPLSGLAICGTSPIGKFPDDMPRAYAPTPSMELAAKRFHSPYEKNQYALHTAGADPAIDPMIRAAVRRTDGQAREQFFNRLKTVDWPRQMRVLCESEVPFAMLNGRKDPFIDNAWCKTLPYANIWRGAPYDFAEGDHAPFLSCPEAFNTAFGEFVDGVTAHGEPSA